MVTVFNYSTPNNYVCGCVATVGAQIMKYWQYPTAEIPQFSNVCSVDESPVTRNSIAGAFNWANMPLSCEKTPTVTEAHQKAIGMLMYNVGVAVGISVGVTVGMTLGSAASSASFSAAVSIAGADSDDSEPLDFPTISGAMNRKPTRIAATDARTAATITSILELSLR